MIKIGNIIIEDWVCESPEPNEEWRRYIVGKTPAYLKVGLLYADSDYSPTTSSSWWLFFYDHHELFETHTAMYGFETRNIVKGIPGRYRKFREFDNKEDAMKHVDEFLLKLSKLKAFL